MLLQLHHQKKKDPYYTKFMAQKDVDGSYEDTHNFLLETQADFPVPEDSQWLFVPYGAPEFLMTTQEALDRAEDWKKL